MQVIVVEFIKCIYFVPNQYLLSFLGEVYVSEGYIQRNFSAPFLYLGKTQHLFNNSANRTSSEMGSWVKMSIFFYNQHNTNETPIDLFKKWNTRFRR